MELWKDLGWPNQEWLLRHVATSLQSQDDGARQEFSDANGFKIATDLLQIVTTASDERQIPCHYGVYWSPTFTKNKLMRRLKDLPNQERLLRNVATSLQSLDDEAKQEFNGS
jgi:hypothetical protein